MTNPIHVDRNQVPAHILKAANYAGRHIQIIATTQVTIPSYDGNWDHGSRTTWIAIHATTGQAVPASDNVSAPWDNNRRDRTITLTPDVLLIKHRIYQGKDMGITIHTHPDTMSQTFLQPATPLLNPTQQLVLYATRRYVASYNGKDRYQLIKSDIHIIRPPWFEGASFPTREQWEEAKAALISLKLLNKAGAITTAGRNAAQTL